MFQDKISKLAVVCCVLWCANVTALPQCSTVNSTSTKLSVTSRRNQTGYWIAQVALDHAGSQEETGPYVLDMDHTSTNCGGEEAVLLVLTMTGPPRKSTSLPKRQRSRPTGYELLPGLGYYKFHNTTQTWYEATQICDREGGHMLILNTEQEFAALKKIWDKTGVVGEHLHVGVNDFDKDGYFVTIFGDPESTTGYNKWKPGEPNSGISAACGAVARSGLMEDSSCANKFFFFCEQRVDFNEKI